ncbi:MAG: GPP34 family phosphoprotein [Actinomycetia bacterium]|nr:GPP34 family phosphoprotein [Actinomycetes bacterium]
MLRFAEEVILLLLDDEDGRFAPVPGWSLAYALAGGVLMDLALENRIDTDLEELVLVDATPVGDSLLDPTLAEIEAGEKTEMEAGEKRGARFWVVRTARRADVIREEALSRLVALGVLERRDDRFLWVFRSRRYPTIDGKAEREVKLRIMGVLFSDEIPDPRDVVLICLADACGIFRGLLSKQELSKVSGRIEQVRKLDLIGQAMSQAIHDIAAAAAAAVGRA